MNKTLNLVALILVIIGGLNWGLVGLLNIDVVAYLFGVIPGLTRIVYILVGIAAIVLLPKLAEK